VWAVNRFAQDLPHHSEVFDEPPPMIDRWIDGVFRQLRRAVRRRFAQQPS